MFNNYPTAATQENWIHESLCAAITTIIQKIDDDDVIPAWPEVIPVTHRSQFSWLTALPRQLTEFESCARALSSQQRQAFLDILHQQNQIPELLDGTIPRPDVPTEIACLVTNAGEIFNIGFDLLGTREVRDRHYQTIYDQIPNKTCPFCGYETLDAPGLPREDEDHYLPRSIYPLAAANLHNLVPMGGRCNSSYKLQQDPLISNGSARKVINPYGELTADVSLVNTDPFGSDDMNPVWAINLLPDIEEIDTWENIFSIRQRLTESVLTPSYDLVLNELSDWLDIQEISRESTDNEVLDSINLFVRYKERNTAGGISFLNHKIAMMIAHHFDSGNRAMIDAIRSCLSANGEAA